ncbi:DUF445 domain-containing protein [Cytobacillus firmus]|uniref:Uncharacterized protein n=3 Tax=Bacillaceae TaxID=186817 RepID=A0A380XH72_CYTFI|nr:DUF445 family protein [Cytobacillus firmus]KAF0823963.1 hypothetical protein KIS1582_2208 [Cytobacillus firmus]MBG9543420.1 hypothetical protein [Cytobacillus firmus]MBG9550860.1 hypothetical protein [Cytobacillus firmus]MBG9556338.1 hypothetical protein [Cytobacillus firmus]MBG9576350.1 hypothetical protein [Cytobacillus firmus]
MEIAMTIILMMIIGALIGGFTNYLAIKMLFKPYNAVYIGKWKVPFTPGLIPKRRDEMADQMGKLVVNHLLTPESIKKKFINDQFQRDMTGLVQKELETILQSEKSAEDILAAFGITDGQVKTEKRIDLLIEQKYEKIISEYRDLPLKEVIPQGLLDKADEKIPAISSMILQKGVDYFSSIEGKMRIQRMADDFVRERSGVLSNMLQMFMGNINLADKIQPEIIRFLSNEGTADLITTLIQKEWSKILEMEAAVIEEQLEKEQILSVLKNIAHRVINLENVFKTPISSFMAPYRTLLTDELAPKSVQMLSDWLSRKTEMVMERLRLAEIVREQVSNFSVERLEDMVFSIIKSELAMITNLGFLLGGIIGLVQGIIAILIN